MATPVMIRIFEVVGSPLCVASDDGLKVYQQIASVLKEGRKAQVSFQNVESLTSAFLNAAIGQLYGEFSEQQIKSSLKVMEMTREDLALLKRVVDTAKVYFKNREEMTKARNEALGDDSEK
jgi:hypothetical protein